MRKIVVFFLLFLSAGYVARAQVAINTDASLPDPSAMLDVKSTTQGLLAPRVTTVQMNAFASPADGLWVYNTDTKTFWYYMAGTGWQQLTGGSGMFTLPYAATVNSTSNLFSITNSGSGLALIGMSTGTGGVGIYGATSAFNGAGLLSDNLNGGESIVGRTVSVSGTPLGAVVGRNDGPGYGVYGFVATDNSGIGIGVLGQSGAGGGTGVAGHFENLNASNGSTALEAVTNGTGSGATITNTNSANAANTLYVTSNGLGVVGTPSQGNAGSFFMNNIYGIGAGVRGETNSGFSNEGAAGIYGVASGTGGYAGYFEHTEATGYGVTLETLTADLGVCSHFESTNASNGSTTVEVVADGLGSAGTFTITNANSTADALYVTSNGGGSFTDLSQGNAGNFFINNTNGVGAGVRGETNSIFANEGAAGVYGVASGTGGYAGFFEHTNASGYGTTLYASSQSQGDVLVVNHDGTAGDLAVFETKGGDVARISRTGVGYFDGGTQNSGADLAEAFDVEGSSADYEPGDVLLISTTADRTVVKCTTAYSPLVAGVYATKPGVLLTEESISGTLKGKVPMGVVGVIPTKVCDEGGAIHRGDILVTSSRPGYAMKADLNRLKPGQAIGKALEEFSDTSGKIKVLVNVK